MWTEKEQIKIPTSEQCQKNERVFENEAEMGYAIWYPQMGGYSSRAIAFIDKEWFEDSITGSSEGGCVDVWVWHDGEFPFHRGENPVELHHCLPSQFITFGKKLTKWNEKGKKEMKR